ncbi:MAG: hypothetical protein HY984_01410 [Candidatus Magasanikbacteria bacterium]|nr:hypothetical protein [Candidatus Magasanikbacteria bacterium]
MKRQRLAAIALGVVGVLFLAPPALAKIDESYLKNNFGLKDLKKEVNNTIITPQTPAGEASGAKPILPTLIGNAIATALSFIAILFFILMLYGGVLWMTARGNEDQTKKALQVIEAAIIGIIIVMGSYALTNFIMNSTKDKTPTPAKEMTVPTAGRPASNAGGGRVACCTYTQALTLIKKKVVDNGFECFDICLSRQFTGCNTEYVESASECQ